MFQPYPHDEFESLERDLRFEKLAEHISPHAESEPYVTDLARAAELPAPARAIYFLWMFQAEVAGNGLEYFLLEQQGHFTPQAHEALNMIGASELVERLEAGIPHALALDAEFTTGSDLAWFRQFQPREPYPDLESVDDGVYDLVESDLLDKVNAFIEAQRAVLVA